MEPISTKQAGCSGACLHPSYEGGISRRIVMQAGQDKKGWLDPN
jgi:hypothetical protein